MHAGVQKYMYVWPGLTQAVRVCMYVFMYVCPYTRRVYACMYA